MQAGKKPNYKALYKQSQAQLEKSRATVKELEGKVEKLTHELSQIKRALFGRKSEKLPLKEIPEGQTRLDFMKDEVIIEQPGEGNEEDDTEEKPSSLTAGKNKKRKKKPRGRFAIPSWLITEEQKIEIDNLPEGTRVIGEEVTYRLEYSPARIWGKTIIRVKYLLPTAEGEDGLSSKIVTAPFPGEVIKNCIAGASLLTALAVEKYVDHLPVNRQMFRFERAGIKLCYTSMIGWISKTCKLLWPIYEHMKQMALLQYYLQMDETTIRVLDPNKIGTTHRGYYWITHAPSPGLVIFEYQRGRDKKYPKQLLKNFAGYLQTDGYSVYNSLGKRKDITHLCCMAHARRYFEQAVNNDQKRAEYALEVFGKLFEIERRYKQSLPRHRLRGRKKKAAPLWKDFGKWLKAEAPKLREGSAIHKAFAYTMRRFERLANYMKDGTLYMDNNLIENTIRPVALGRKSYLFAGSDEAAQRAAMLYSFMGTCKLHGVNPMTWMTDVLERIGNHPEDKIHELLPAQWKKDNPEKIIIPQDAIIRVPHSSKKSLKIA